VGGGRARGAVDVANVSKEAEWKVMCLCVERNPSISGIDDDKTDDPLVSMSSSSTLFAGNTGLEGEVAPKITDLRDGEPESLLMESVGKSCSLLRSV